MKRIYLPFMLSLIFALSASAQTREYRISGKGTKSSVLTLKDFTGNLSVEGYTGTEIIITSSLPAVNNERARGLQAIYASGTDNTGIGLYMVKSDNKIELQCLLPVIKKGDYAIMVPKNYNVKVNKDCARYGTITLSKLSGEVEVKNCSDINLKNISGPVVLSTISGDVNLQLDNMPKGKVFSINSVSGEIDIMMPSSAGVDIQMSNLSGQIYSDFDLQDQKRSLRQVGGNNIKAAVNGGGASLKVANISGSIYLRKKK
ncbi:DUF4097 family beta strand repeat-containing protein [Haoranjiania flava]|uniref:DUF4097 domain-containing protein n=1 Tax=Haoranjiania flava TaxID=1856322 RepID=A0AAE3LNP1_9BACT|nr:DUF4097 family beta strand repeat-containing protein [Haoranjiania flava]MCU7695261.1 hypothetical protein [Haoranjiania flava]